MKNWLIKYNIALSAFVLFLAFSGLGLYFIIASKYHSNYKLNSLGSEILSDGLSGVQLSGAVYLLIHSNFFQTRYARYLRLCISLLIIATAFKIFHWQGADLLLTLAYPLFIIVYFLRFMNKPVKNIGDYFKMLWVFFAGIGIMLSSVHWPYGEWFSLIGLVLIIAAVTYQVFYGKKVVAEG
jgi:hypothetical protein